MNMVIIMNIVTVPIVIVILLHDSANDSVIIVNTVTVPIVIVISV